MQQRVAIGQALMTNPRILLMDEAFSALDPATRREMQRLVRRLWEETRSTILFVTHNTHEAIALGTRVVVLAKQQDGGSRVALDSPLPPVTTGRIEKVDVQPEKREVATPTPAPVVAEAESQPSAPAPAPADSNSALTHLDAAISDLEKEVETDNRDLARLEALQRGIAKKQELLGALIK